MNRTRKLPDLSPEIDRIVRTLAKMTSKQATLAG